MKNLLGITLGIITALGGYVDLGQIVFTMQAGALYLSIVFGMVILPLTYYPILRVAADRNLMCEHVNSTFDNILGVVFLVLIIIAAVAAIPLMILTNSGKP